MKKIISLLIFILLLNFGFSATITSFSANTDIPIDQILTATGTYLPLDDNGESTLCKFITYNDKNIVVERLSDELTFSDGSFYTQRKITEPTYLRASTYRIRAVCGTSYSDAYFNVGQREGFDNFFIGEVLFWKDNTYSFFLFMLIITFGVGAISVFVWIWYKSFKQ